jgi:REP element-mobilizing transposase RayT
MHRSPHSKDLRKGRYSQPGGIYLLTWTTENRIPWFTDWHLGRLVVTALSRAHGEGKAESLAFVIMPDHVHWLITLMADALSTLVRNVKSQAGFLVKHRLLEQGRIGQDTAIWQDGYHDHALRSEESVEDVARYIVMNPVRAGLVKSIRQYPLWDAKWL